MPERIQRQRTKGWRMPEGAVYVGRPTPYGNPFPWDGERATWIALAFGQRADEPGRRAAAVIGFRWWIAGCDPNAVPIPTSIPGTAENGGEIEYSSGARRSFGDIAVGMGAMMAFREPLVLPPAPDLAPLRGHDLVCWCKVSDEYGHPVPCHADVLLEVANEPTDRLRAPDREAV